MSLTVREDFAGTFAAARLVGDGRGVVNIPRANIQAGDARHVVIDGNDGLLATEAHLSTLRGGLGGDWSEVTPFTQSGHTTYFIPGITSTGTFGQFSATDIASGAPAGSILLRNAVGVPTAPDQAAGDGSSNIANTLYVDNAAKGVGYSSNNGWISGGAIILANQSLYPFGFYVTTVKVRWSDYGSSDPLTNQETHSPPLQTSMVTYTLDGETPSGAPQFYADVSSFPYSTVVAVYIDNTGTVQQDGSAFNIPKLYNNWIQLGAVGVDAQMGMLYTAANVKYPLADRGELVAIDFFTNVTPLNLGPNMVSANGSLALSLNMSGGSFWEPNCNININRYQPNIKRIDPATSVPIIGLWQDVSPKLSYTAADIVVDTVHYNPNASSAVQPLGSPPADVLPTNSWANMTIMYSPAANVFFFQYPTEAWGSGTKSGPYLVTDTAVTSGAFAQVGKMVRLSAYSDTKAFVVVGYITFQAGCVDLSGATFSAGEFFNYTVGGSAGATTSGGGAAVPYRASNTAWVDHNLGSDVAGTVSFANLPFQSIPAATAALLALSPSASNQMLLFASAGVFTMTPTVDPKDSPLLLAPFVVMEGRSKETTMFNTNNANMLSMVAGPLFASTNNAEGSCLGVRLYGTTSLNLDLVATVDSATNHASFDIGNVQVGGSTVFRGRANGTASPPTSADSAIFTEDVFDGSVTVSAGSAMFVNCHMPANTVTVTATDVISNVTFSNCNMNNLTVSCTSLTAGVFCYVLLANCQITGTISLVGASDRVTLLTDRASITINPSGYAPGTATVSIYDAELTNLQIAGIRNAGTPLTDLNPVVDQTTFRAATVNGTPVYQNPVIYASSLSTSVGQALGNGISGTTQAYTDSSTLLATTAFVHALGNQYGGYPVIDNSTHVISNSYVDYANSGVTAYVGTWNDTALPSGSPKVGQYWILTGDNVINGTQYRTGDWIIYNGTWTKVDNFTYGMSSIAPSVVVATNGSSIAGALSLSAHSVLANATASAGTTLSSLAYSSVNSAGTLVVRDEFGDFSAGVIVANTIGTGTMWDGDVIGSTHGGAGTVSGLLKANGSGVVSAAVAYPGAGSDYVAAPYTVVISGIVSGSGTTSISTSWNNSIPVNSVVANTSHASAGASDGHVSYSATSVNDTLVLRDSGSGIAVGAITATSIGGNTCAWGGAVIPSNKGGSGSVTGILKADGSGNVSAATVGVDYMSASQTLTLNGLISASGALAGTISTSLTSPMNPTSVLANTAGSSGQPNGSVRYGSQATSSWLACRDSYGSCDFNHVNESVNRFQTTGVTVDLTLSSQTTWVCSDNNYMQAFVLPDTATIPAGHRFTFINNQASLGLIIYLYNAVPSVVLVTVASTMSCTVVCNVSSATQSWSVMMNAMPSVPSASLVANTLGVAAPASGSVAYSASSSGSSIVQRDSNANSFSNQWVAGYHMTSPINTGGNTLSALTVASAKTQEYSGTTAYAVANTLALPAAPASGTEFLIINSTQGPITINDSSSVLVASVESGARAGVMYNGSGWSQITYGGSAKTSAPLMSYPPDMTAGNIAGGAGNVLTVAQMYNTINCYGSSASRDPIYLTAAADLVSGLTAILGYRPPAGFTFTTRILIQASAIYTPSFYRSGTYSWFGPLTRSDAAPYVFTLICTITNSASGSEAYNVLSV